MEPTHVVSRDGSKTEPAASRPLRDDDDEFRELTLAHRGIARAPRHDKKSWYKMIDVNDRRTIDQGNVLVHFLFKLWNIPINTLNRLCVLFE